MQFQYGKAPLNYIDGIPAHKAGEWPGIKSCKFHSYKRVIRQPSTGIIFKGKYFIYNYKLYIETDPPLPCHRKLLSPPPSSEMVFRPCLKRVQSQTSYIERPQGIKMVPKPQRLSSARPEGKKSYFPYRIERAEKEQKLLKEMNTAHFVHDEFRLLQHIGFVKKDYSMLPNKQLMNLTFMRDQFGSLKMDDDFNNYIDCKSVKNMRGYNELSLKQKRDIFKKINQNKKNQLTKDIKYVSDLNKWENMNFPKVIKPVVENNKIENIKENNENNNEIIKDNNENNNNNHVEVNNENNNNNMEHQELHVDKENENVDNNNEENK